MDRFRPQSPGLYLMFENAKLTFCLRLGARAQARAVQPSLKAAGPTPASSQDERDYTQRSMRLRSMRRVLPGSLDLFCSSSWQDLPKPQCLVWGLGLKRLCQGRKLRSYLDPYVWSGPARCKRFRQLGRCGLASMYPASDWSVLCSGPSWISARIRAN
jgi:hypothetical protein